MSIDIGSVLRTAIRRTGSRNGIIFIGVFFLLAVLNGVLIDSIGLWFDSIAAGFDEVDPMLAEPGPLAFSLPGSVILLLGLVSFVTSAAISVITVRTMVTEHVTTIPDELISHRLSTATINDLLGNIVATFLIVIGFIFLIIPGIFLAICFFFLRPFIAVEDKNFIDALVDSWTLSRGNRIEILILLLVVFIVGLVLAIPGVGIELVGGETMTLVNAALSPALSAITTVFGLTVTARAYVQLSDTKETTDETEEEWPDPPGLDI